MKNPISVNNAMRERLRELWRDPSGATAVEFVLVFMMVVMFTIALFEFGLAWYAYNRAELGTQWGVRFAVESDPVAGGFNSYDGISTSTPSGTSLDTTALPAFTVRCTNTSCSCLAGSCTDFIDNPDYDATAFTAIYNKVQTFVWNLQPANLQIDYTHVGIGFAGRPGPDVVPNVTVRLVNLQHSLLVLTLFYPVEVPPSFSMPEFKSTLPGEDLCSSGATC